MRVAIVGGGRAALAMIEEFEASGLVEIVGIADPSREAPARRLAASRGWPTFDAASAMLARVRCELVLEVTGVPAVQREVMEHLEEGQQLMGAAGARLMVDVAERRIAAELSEHSAAIERLSGDLGGAVGRIDGAASDISRVLREINILAINGSVEAARAGQAGAGFAVIVDRMQNLVKDVASALERVGGSAKASREVLAELEKTRQSLERAATTGGPDD